MPDVLALLSERANALVGACWEPRQSEARATWLGLLGSDWLSPSDRLVVFRERLLAEGCGRPKDLHAVDLSLPGGRRPRKIVRKRLEGGHARAEFADVQEEV